MNNNRLSTSGKPVIDRLLLLVEVEELLNGPSNFEIKNGIKIDNSINKLHPWFITGFVDGEGSFNIKIVQVKQLKLGFQIQASFELKLHSRDSYILSSIKSFFGEIGYITINNEKNYAEYRVVKLNDILNILIPHFNKFPLLTQKRADFELFKLAIETMSRKEHLTQEGLHKILAIKASLNRGLSEELELAFPGIVPVLRPLVQNQTIRDPFWVAGFASGEGCFYIKIKSSACYNNGYQTSLVYKITQHSRDDELMKSLIPYFGCGRYESYKDIGDFVVTNFNDLTEKVIPKTAGGRLGFSRLAGLETFFDKYKIIGEKSRDFDDFKKVALLMKNKAHLTKEGLEEIRLIKTGMNNKRK